MAWKSFWIFVIICELAWIFSSLVLNGLSAQSFDRVFIYEFNLASHYIDKIGILKKLSPPKLFAASYFLLISSYCCICVDFFGGLWIAACQSLMIAAEPNLCVEYRINFFALNCAQEANWEFVNFLLCGALPARLARRPWQYWIELPMNCIPVWNWRYRIWN